MDQRSVRMDSEMAQHEKIKNDIEKAKQQRKYADELMKLIK